ncbi:MAG: PocR ligand-binding domain-containing protein, partial [Clostridiales bacterium]
MLFTYEGNIILSRLNELLKTYFMATGISIMAIDTQGNTLLSYGDSFDFCQILNDNTENACNCQDSHLQACKYAINVGEAYFFFCPHEFVNIAVPLVHQEKFLGGLLVGPLIVKTNTADFDSENFIKKRFPNLSKEKLAEIQDIFQQIPITDPIRTNYLGNMLYMMASQEME